MNAGQVATGFERNELLSPICQGGLFPPSRKKASSNPRPGVDRQTPNASPVDRSTAINEQTSKVQRVIHFLLKEPHLSPQKNQELWSCRLQPTDLMTLICPLIFFNFNPILKCPPNKVPELEMGARREGWGVFMADGVSSNCPERHPLGRKANVASCSFLRTPLSVRACPILVVCPIWMSRPVYGKSWGRSCVHTYCAAHFHLVRANVLGRVVRRCEAPGA